MALLPSLVPCALVKRKWNAMCMEPFRRWDLEWFYSLMTLFAYWTAMCIMNYYEIIGPFQLLLVWLLFCQYASAVKALQASSTPAVTISSWVQHRWEGSHGPSSNHDRPILWLPSAFLFLVMLVWRPSSRCLYQASVAPRRRKRKKRTSSSPPRSPACHVVLLVHEKKDKQEEDTSSN